MSAQVKVPNPFGADYEDPLEALKSKQEPNVTKQNNNKPPSSPNTDQTLNEIGTVGTVSTVSIDSQPSTVSRVRSVSTLKPVSTKNRTLPTAPERDFQKVANSVVRGVSQGIFNGKSKQMYDYLYSLTRGAIQPRRTIRISKPKLMKGTGIGSPQTFYRNINHLESLGLIKRNEIVGEWSGNEYEIFLPEEINLQMIESVQSVNPVQSDQSAQKQVVLVVPETELTDYTSYSANTGVSATSKTSFKDSTNIDDEANLAKMFASMNLKLASAVKKVTGKEGSKADVEKWGDLAELLILELEVAARRAGGISSVPAFLTEVLRRQFFTARQPKPEKVSKAKPDTVGKSESDNFEIKPLDEQGREAALEQLKEFADESFLEDFRKWYTEEDWEWLMKKLKDSSNENL